MFVDIDWLVLLWCSLALLCGGLIKGTLGVGTPLLTVPMMALVLPAHTAVALMAMPVVVANVWQAIQSGQPRVAMQRFWPMFVGILLGTWAGVYILRRIEEATLLFFVGITVIAFALLQGSRRRIEISPRFEKPAGAAFGIAAGGIGGVSSMFGPMMIIYLVSVRDLPRDAFVGAISFLYLAAVVPWALALYAVGILDHRLLLLSTLAAVVVSAGVGLGQVLRARVTEARFRALIIAVLIVSGFIMLWRAVQS